MTVSRMIRCINGHVFDATAQAACPNCGWTELGKAATGDSNSSNGSGTENGTSPVPPNPNRKVMIAGAAAFGAIAIGIASYAFLKPAPVPVPDPITKVPDKVAEKTPEKAREKPPEVVPEKVPEKAPEKTPEVVPEKVPEKFTEVVPEKVPAKEPEKAPVVIPDKVPEKLPEKAPEKTPEKVIEKQPEPQPVIKVEPPVPPVTNGLTKFDALEPLTQDTQISAATALGLSPFATETALLTRATLLAEHFPIKLEALRLLVPFVKNNQPQALEVAGGASLHGDGVEVNEQIALDYLTRGADQGATRARIELAEMLRLGRGKPKDEKAATDLYVLVARADSKMGQQIIPLLATLKIAVNGKGPTATDLQNAYESSNWELSLKLAHELADVQIAKGYHVLGLLSLDGHGVPKDQAAAIDWFKKASAIGYSPASYNLSVVAKTPPVGSGNFVEAMVWLEIAFVQSENKQRSLYYTDKISEQVGLLDRNQWAAIKTLFADITIPGPG